MGRLEQEPEHRLIAGGGPGWSGPPPQHHIFTT